LIDKYNFIRGGKGGEVGGGGGGRGRGGGGVGDGGVDDKGWLMVKDQEVG
jgi:hypothetical protein